MDILKLISKRRSVRHYLPDEVEQEKIDYLMECARLAPSAVNFQPWKFLIAKSPESRTALQKCYPAKWFTSAPVYIVALGDRNLSWKRNCDGKDHFDVDVAIAVEHIVLAAVEKNLGTCWVCNFDADLCRKELALSENFVPIAIIPVGYPARQMECVVNRKTTGEIVEII